MCDLWDSSTLDYKDHQKLVEAYNSIKDNRSAAAIILANQCCDSDAKNLILALAYERLENWKKVQSSLVHLILKSTYDLTYNGYKLAIFLFRRAAEGSDKTLAKVLEDSENVTGEDVVSSVIKSFYFSNNTENNCTLYQEVQKREKKLEVRSRQVGSIRPLECHMDFLKNFSSSTHLTDDSEESLGGGYFLVVNGFGCVIDPGYNFLTNFFKRYKIADINAIIVTHCHDDHNADMPALLSLLYRQSNKEKKVQLYLDNKTFTKYKDLIESSGYIQKPCRPVAASFDEWSVDGDYIELSSDIRMQTIPAQHRLVPDDKSNSAFGLHFVLHNIGQDCHLVISGDTAWKPDLMGKIYSCFSQFSPVLVAHISTACEREALGVIGLDDGGYHSNHLGVRGVVEMIHACSPSKVILSEVGEELGTVINNLANLIRKGFKIPCYVGMLKDQEGAIISLVHE